MKDFKETPLFRTLVDIPTANPPIRPSDGFVFLGSCFAQYVGGKFAEYGLPSLVNPLGTLYNPCSIDMVISQAARPDFGSFLFRSGEAHCCWLAGTQIKADSEQGISTLTGNALARLRKALSTGRYLFITLGTNVAYRHRELNRVVCNCHRMPQSLFEEISLSLEECVETLQHSVRTAQSLNPDIRIVFTVSPYRYAKYGFHRSQLAKSTLLLAIDAVRKSFPQVCSYFPSYEIQLDELRDYRFYAADMLHPSPEAVDYIWQRLVHHTFSDEAKQYLRAYEPIRKGLDHRSLTPDSAEEKARLTALREKAALLQQQYALPSLNL